MPGSTATPASSHFEMAMKQWVRRLQPLALYAMLAATVVFLVLQLVLAHATHALTLLVDAYHMLCNLVALAGCIITIKYSSEVHEHDQEEEVEGQAEMEDAKGESGVGGGPPPGEACTQVEEQRRLQRASARGQRRLKNTFGWARIDVLAQLVVCVLLASFCFSLVVEAVQTLVHIGHQDEMHHPLLVLAMGAAGLLLNGLCYLLIGGYTFHQASFLQVTPSGDVVLAHAVTRRSVQQGRRRLSSQARQPPLPPPQQQPRQGPREMCRDTLGSILVIICAVIVYFTDVYVAKFVDPILSIISAVSLLVLSYPYMKESGLILLQTIPDTINIDSFRVELIREFPDIINVHDLHVWRLTPSKVFCTAHIIFLNPKDYAKKSQKIIDFFEEQGITQVTIQPEFFETDNDTNIIALPSIEEKSCLVQCRGQGCIERHCCLKLVPGISVDPACKQLPQKGAPDKECIKISSHSVVESTTLPSDDISEKIETAEEHKACQSAGRQTPDEEEQVSAADETQVPTINESSLTSEAVKDLSQNSDKHESEDPQQECL
ncbi:zinc transporter 1 isoform X1 [Schistocerca nitens]|uniref:zinc transporter 1 isoform X1 n=2 Tax=Schistocerca nitens TaxID=7011 RepID=UPI0021175AC2|nr:zinc transporter 1 isoform X1 [Schistocerca nitens]